MVTNESVLSLYPGISFRGGLHILTTSVSRVHVGGLGTRKFWNWSPKMVPVFQHEIMPGRSNQNFLVIDGEPLKSLGGVWPLPPQFAPVCSVFIGVLGETHVCIRDYSIEISLHWWWT